MYFKTIKSFLRNRLIKKKTNQRNYKNVLFSIPLSGLIMLSSLSLLIFNNIIFLILFLSFFSCHFLLNYSFFKFIFETKGLANAFFAIFLNITDNILMGIATFFGSIDFFLGNKY